MKQHYIFIFACLLTLTGIAQPLPERAVEPLLRTIRVQTAPYNKSCPYYNYGDSISSEPCYVGCVATALEQLLSYYRYPVCLHDSIAGWSTDNFSIASVPAGTKIDWEDVADLSLWCGMIVKMKYGPTSSAASLWKAEEPLQRVFGYKTVKILDRSLYSFDAWHRILQNELLAGRPVAYVGYTNLMSGHAFNIDGISEDGLYHCNWGEGEHCNGYFRLEHLSKLQPYWDETDWGRMMGWHANEYMLVLHPDSVTDVLMPDTLADFANAVRVDDISFRRPITDRHYVLTDVKLTNTSEDTLFQTYEIIQNSPSDTSLLEQCTAVSLSAVKLMPGETRTQTVAAHYPAKPGKHIVSITFDGLTVPFSKTTQADASAIEQLSFEISAVNFIEQGTAQIIIRTRNGAKNGVCGRMIQYKLYPEGSDLTCSRDFRFLNLHAGATVQDTIVFHRLKLYHKYVLHVGDWGTSEVSATFEVPLEPTSIHDIQQIIPQKKHTPLYDINGRTIQYPSKGIYITNGKTIYYETGGNHRETLCESRAPEGTSVETFTTSSAKGDGGAGQASRNTGR